MSKSHQFFATRDDILGITRLLEADAPVKYVRSGMATSLPPETFDSAAHIPNLGTASSPSAASCDSFLVCEPETKIIPRRLKTLTEDDVNRTTFSIGGQEIATD